MTRIYCFDWKVPIGVATLHESTSRGTPKADDGFSALCGRSEGWILPFFGIGSDDSPMIKLFP
jgi:hypothetical protein